MSVRAESWINRVWYEGSMWFLPLLPLSWLYALVTSLRRYLYRSGIWRSRNAGVPVIVIGNITTGGTGKTPLTVMLVQELRQRGFSPGIVSRGYRGNVGASPIAVTAKSDPAIVGDEPVLLAKRCLCPVVVHPNRVAAAKTLRDQGVDVIIADDGLQHYRLARDVEIAVVDGKRLWGNQRLLPAGPLREPVSRLRSVNHILVQGGGASVSIPGMNEAMSVTEFSLRLLEVCRLDGESSKSLEDFKGQRIHAVAAIGNPDRFFDALEEYGMDVIRHPFPDHATLTDADLAFDEQCDVLMTEKDAVKCRGIASEKIWYVPVEVMLGEAAKNTLMEQIEESIGRYVNSSHV